MISDNEFKLTPSDLHCAMVFANNSGLAMAAARYARAIIDYAAHAATLGSERRSLYIKAEWLANAIAIDRSARSPLGLNSEESERSEI